jgi:hypothetical protein
MAPKKSGFSTRRVPEVVQFFYTIDTSDGVEYKCNNCSATPAQAVNTGYTNLRKHLKKCIGKDYNEKYLSAVKARRSNLGFEVIEYVAERDLVVYRWIVWVLMRNQPLSEVDNVLTRGLAGMSSEEHVSSQSLSSYIKALVPLVEAEIASIIPEAFAIMFDGWTDKKTHYIAVFAVFVYDNKVQEVLIGFSPPLDEKSYTAEAHRDLIAFMLQIYNRNLRNVTVLIGDNCKTNRKTAKLPGVPLLGCACHKLNLAIKKFIQDQEGVEDGIASIHFMVSKATGLKASSALRELTELVPLLENDTRWSSTYTMIKRFFRIEDELRLVDDVEVPRKASLQCVRDLLPTLEKFDSIIVDLQTAGITVAYVRGTFDVLLDDFPELSHYLAQDAEIVHVPRFESAVTKVLNNTTGDLSMDERELVQPYQKPQLPPPRQINWGETRTYAEEVQERKRQRLERVVEYQDLRYMLGTSASVERLFSIAKNVMTDRRRCMSPWMFENIMFLRTNRVFWTSKTVAKAIRNSHPSNNAGNGAV